MALLFHRGVIMTSAMFSTCGFCGASVLPMNDGLCPNCRFSTEEKAPAQAVLKGSQPIAGWLVLPALGLLISPIRSMFEIRESWRLLNHPTLNLVLGRHPSLSTALEWGMVQNALLLFLQLGVAVLFFRKKRSAPGAYIILLLAGLGSTVIEMAFLTDVPGLKLDGSSLLPSIIPCAIWIPYFIVSQRVRDTFTID